MNWKFHIDFIKRKINKIRGIIYKVRNLATRDVLMKIYYALVYSYLNYSVMSWGGAYKSNIDPLQRAQNKVLKTILFLSYDSPTNPVYTTLRVLKIQEIFHSNCLFFIYKYHYSLLPPAFCAYFHPVSNVHNYLTRSTTSDDYYLPPFRTDNICFL